MSKLSPLNVIFWNGKDVGTKNTRSSVVIDEMLEYCLNADFTRIIQGNCRKQCDVIILGEIYPTSDDKKFNSLVHQEKDVGGRFLGKIVSLGGRKTQVGKETVNEHFLVAYNTGSVAKVELKLLPIDSLSIQKGLLEISVYRKKPLEGTSQSFAHKIIAVHLENDPAKRRKAIDYALQQFISYKKNRDGSSSENKAKFPPHLLIGDTNTTEESVKKENTNNGNALVLPSMVQEIVFKNPELGSTRKSGHRTGLPVDRAWFNTDLIQAEGTYLSGSQRIFNLPEAVQKDIKDTKSSTHLSIGVSDHPAMAVVLKAN